MRYSQEELDMALFDAVNRGELQEVKSLIKQGADLEAKNPIGKTPLMSAAWVAAEDIVEYFLSIGADINYRDPEGLTALTKARTVGHNEYGHDVVIEILERAHGIES